MEFQKLAPSLTPTNREPSVNSAMPTGKSNPLAKAVTRKSAGLTPGPWGTGRVVAACPLNHASAIHAIHPHPGNRSMEQSRLRTLGVRQTFGTGILAPS